MQLTFLAALTATLLGGLPAVDTGPNPTALAAGPTTCRATYDVAIKPGISNTPTRGTIHTVRAGTISCDGPVLGQNSIGPGRVVVIARLDGRPRTEGASCLDGGAGTVTLHVRLPSADGAIELFDVGDYTVGGLADGLVRGKVTGDHIDGTYTATPTKGDCVTSALTRGRVELTATLHAYRAPR